MLFHGFTIHPVRKKEVEKSHFAKVRFEPITYHLRKWAFMSLIFFVQLFFYSIVKIFVVLKVSGFVEDALCRDKILLINFFSKRKFGRNVRYWTGVKKLTFKILAKVPGVQ